MITRISIQIFQLSHMMKLSDVLLVVQETLSSQTIEVSLNPYAKVLQTNHTSRALDKITVRTPVLLDMMIDLSLKI